MEVAALSIGMKTLSGYKSNSQNCSACMDMSEAVSKTDQCPKLVPQNVQCPVTNCARKSAQFLAPICPDCLLRRFPLETLKPKRSHLEVLSLPCH